MGSVHSPLDIQLSCVPQSEENSYSIQNRALVFVLLNANESIVYDLCAALLTVTQYFSHYLTMDMILQ